MKKAARKKSAPSVAPRPKTAGVSVLSSRIVYRAPVFYVATNQVQEANGKVVRRDIIYHPGSVVIMPVDDSGSEPKVLLARQYRFAADKYMWELPAGHIDQGEEPLAAGKRELLEETGYTARHWRRILHFFVSPGFLNETMSIFMATGLKPGKAQQEEDESISKRWFPLRQALSMVQRGKIDDAKTISSILWLDAHLRSS